MIGSSLEQKMEVFIESLFANLSPSPIHAITPEMYRTELNLQQMESAMLTAGFKTFNPQSLISVIGSAVFRRMVAINEALTA